MSANPSIGILRDLGPKIYLSATDKKALDIVSMSELKRYATKEK